MPSQKYEKVAPPPSDSGSDVTVTLGDEEAAWKEGYEPHSRWRAALDKVRPLRWLFEAGLVAVIVLLLLCRREEHQHAGDVTGFAPRCKFRQEETWRREEAWRKTGANGRSRTKGYEL